ncbi:MAG: hypothetical protein ACI8QS_002133 [Planctomycetota bacterium]|jgi:hypothetical protein
MAGDPPDFVRYPAQPPISFAALHSSGAPGRPASAMAKSLRLSSFATAALLITGLLAFPIGFAQGSTSQEEVEAPVSLPNAGALVRKALRATGELDAINKSSARTLTGTIMLPGAEKPGTISILQARPNLFLQTSRVPEVGQVQIGFDGKTTWMMHPTGGALILDGIVAGQERVRNAFDFPLHTRKHMRSMETVARREFDGRDCYEIRCELVPFIDQGQVLNVEATLRYRVFTEFYEVESGLLAGAEVLQASPQGEIRSTTIYSEYKELLPGLRVATKLVTKVNNSEITTTVTSVSLEPLLPAAFALPAEVRALLNAPTPAGEGGAEGEEGDGGDEDGGTENGDDGR